MLKKSKWIIPVIVVLALGLVACSNNGTSGDLTAEDILVNSNTAMSEVNSYSAITNMNMDVAIEGMNMKMVMSGTGDCTLKPQVMMKMDTAVTFDIADQEQSIKSTMYIEQDGNNLNTYTYTDNAWTAETLTIDNLDQYMTQNPQEMIKLYNENKVSTELLGKEAVDGTECHKLKITVSPEAFSEMMSMMGDMSSMGIDEQTLAQSQEMLKQGGGFDVTLWIAEDSYLVIKESVDLSQFMLNLMKSMLNTDSASANVESITMTVDATYNNYNGVDSIVIPEEARAAANA